MADLEQGGKLRRGGGKAEETLNDLTARIISCAMKVHSSLGPGLLETAYEECLCHALAKDGLKFRRQAAVPIEFDGVNLDCGFRLDLVIEDRVVVEIKAVEKVMPIHFSQLMTYLKLSRIPSGLLLNFNVAHLRDGISRRTCLSP